MTTAEQNLRDAVKHYASLRLQAQHERQDEMLRRRVEGKESLATIAHDYGITRQQVFNLSRKALARAGEGSA